mgnify:CR=1 FL=1
MKGYYAIYNHQRNAWWTNGHWWISDTSYETTNIPTNINLSKWVNSEGETMIDLQQSNFRNVVIWNNNIEKNPHNIMVFDNIVAAENALLHNIVPEYNEFFTIRKIYY